jgi:hypothetical protein
MISELQKTRLTLVTVLFKICLRRQLQQIAAENLAARLLFYVEKALAERVKE